MEPAEERHGLARTGVTKGSTWNIRTGLRARGRGCEAKFGRLVGDGGGGWYAGGMILRGDNAGGRGSRPPSDGVTAAMPTGDADTDGDWDATDSADIGSNYTPGSAYAVRRDADLDGDVDANDVTHASSITGGYQTLGRDVLTSAGVRSRIGYAGYQYDPTFAGLDRHLYHVRFRVYDAELGRWTRRDPLGYVDGRSLYEYVRSQSLAARDPFGLLAAGCSFGSKCGGIEDPPPWPWEIQPMPPWWHPPLLPHPTEPWHCINFAKSLLQCNACCKKYFPGSLDGWECELHCIAKFAPDACDEYIGLAMDMWSEDCSRIPGAKQCVECCWDSLLVELLRCEVFDAASRCLGISSTLEACKNIAWDATSRCLDVCKTKVFW